MRRRLSEVRGVTLDAVDDSYVVSDGGGTELIFASTDLDKACAAVFEVAAGHTDDDATKARLRATATSYGHVAALNRRDWDSVRATLDESFAWMDHRPASYGRIEGADTYVSISRGNAEAVATSRWTLTDLLAMSERTVLVEVRIEGDLDGGAIEVAALVLVVHGDSGLAVAYETFSLEARDEALAAFAGRDAPPPSIPLRRLRGAQ